MKEWKSYINGEWTDASEKIKISNPSTNKPFATVPKGGATEARQAVDAASGAFAAWSQKTAEERAQLLMKWHALIEEQKKDIGRIMTEEQGKPLAEAIGEVQYANSFIAWYAEEGKRVYGETIPASSSNKRMFVTRQPVGVVAAITPWNFPAAMITRKVGPALASGCTAVVKPASATPLTALKLAELAHKAGIPEGVLNVVTGDSKAIAGAWMEDSRVRKVTFTGSTEIGKVLMKQAADTMKKVSLELGGHAPFIVTGHADVTKAAKGLLGSKFRNAGQTCVCANRVYVHRSVEKKFTEAFKEEVRSLRVGDGMEEGVNIGPLIDADAVEKVKQQLEDAKSKGAVVELGGDITDHFVSPIVLTNVSDNMECMKEETFGPLAPITSYETTEEVIQRANNTPFGLAAYVFSENISEAIRITEGLEYGIVGLNDGLPSAAQAPFGGFKESGLGREGGHHGMAEFLEVKYISLGL